MKHKLEWYEKTNMSFQNTCTRTVSAEWEFSFCMYTPNGVHIVNECNTNANLNQAF